MTTDTSDNVVERVAWAIYGGPHNCVPSSRRWHPEDKRLAIQQARAAIAAKQAWQPISTYPNDGTPAWLAYPDRTVQRGSQKKGSFTPKDGLGPADGYLFQTVNAQFPSHWMPYSAPAPPEAREA